MIEGKKKKGGARPGAGRKPKEQSDELRSLLDKSWPLTERERAIRKHAQQAAEGNVKSFSLLLNHAYGTPVQRHELSNPDGTAITQPIADALDKVYGNGTGAGK